ncbi:malate dehydrogenase-like [Pyrus x bretschneideri]|uniref:malate dehydrogenase-like n=1 Tax=Pyrus x bretschneideri TaxID=225117 RepID=UPI00202DF314|nr:malate dehydrogenase-like [Pyrus x bretschneideri]
MLGADQPVILHLLDIPPAAEALNGVKMELVDAAFPLLKGIVATTDVVEACTGVNIAVMVGGFPRKEGMERKDVMTKNVSIYRSQASALEKYAAPNCKNAIIWGNHSSSQYPDVNHATVKIPSGEKGVRELVANDAWLNGEFISTVQQRGAAIIKLQRMPS